MASHQKSTWFIFHLLLRDFPNPIHLSKIQQYSLLCFNKPPPFIFEHTVLVTTECYVCASRIPICSSHNTLLPPTCVVFLGEQVNISLEGLRRLPWTNTRYFCDGNSCFSVGGLLCNLNQSLVNLLLEMLIMSVE